MRELIITCAELWIPPIVAMIKSRSLRQEVNNVYSGQYGTLTVVGDRLPAVEIEFPGYQHMKC